MPFLMCDYDLFILVLVCSKVASFSLVGKAIEKEGAYFGYVKLPPPPPPPHQIFDLGDNFVVTLTDQRTLKYSDLWKSDN